MPALLRVILQEQIDIPIRQAAVIYLKNTICQYWDEKATATPSEPIPFSIHETDKVHVREHLIEAVIKAPVPVRCVLQLVSKYLAELKFKDSFLTGGMP